MKPIFRTLAVAILFTAATGAIAQTSGSGNNPLRRGGDVFSYGRGGSNGAFSSNPNNTSGFGRPQARSYQAAVTPVPEPSQWAMMLAGLALVGFIVRRNARRS